MKASVVFIHHITGAYDNEVLRLAPTIEEIDVVIHP